MSIYSKIGATIVIIALICYSIGIITERMKKRIITKVLVFMSIGVLFDITATIFMIIGSGKGFSLHGLLGYSSLALMLIDTILLYRFRMLKGLEATVSKSLHTYTILAYTWWVLAFITGGLLVAFR